MTLSSEEYHALVDAEQLLNALYDCGVDNWEGYDDAMRLYEVRKQDYTE